MKKTIIIAIAILLAGTATFAQAKPKSTTKHHSEVAAKYTCPMHPEVVRSKAGKCPKCGMALVPMTKKTTKVKKPGDMKM